VERRFEHTFQKWNNNNGGLCLKTEDDDKDRGQGSYELLVIDDDEHTRTNTDNIQFYVISQEVSQAFSHFSFHHGLQRYVICDLQGSYDPEHRLFRFTDPVIHYSDNQKPHQTQVFGRSDRGRRGIDNFMDTHRCNCLCKMITRGLRKVG